MITRYMKPNKKEKEEADLPPEENPTEPGKESPWETPSETPTRPYEDVPWTSPRDPEIPSSPEEIALKS